MAMKMSRTTTRARRASAFGVLLAVAALLAGACSTPVPEPLAKKEAAPKETIDPANPCTGKAEQGATPPSTPAAGGVTARFNRATNSIDLTAGQGVTLPALARSSGGTLQQTGDGEWTLTADIVVHPGASLVIAAPEVRWLKLVGGNPQYASIKAFGGNLDVTGSCITSWDPATNQAKTDHTSGRGYLLARDGAQMNIDHSEIRYLGHGEVESYGLSWRTEGTGGKLTNSISSHNYFGMYSYEVGGLVISDNQFHDNVLYGVDPHTGSHNLTIERNVVHDNGKHGIILAEDCTDSVIRDNIVFRNAHHGIVLYLRSDRNVIEGNDTFGNASQGINVNESSENTVRNNRVYDNTEDGIAITQTSHNNLVENNQARGNQKDGVRVVSESTQTTVRNNVLGENTRYGVYVDVDGSVDISGNQIFANRAGIMLKGPAVVGDSDNSVFDNREEDILRD
jgi:parallel beta-helix repeat protein